MQCVHTHYTHTVAHATLLPTSTVQTHTRVPFTQAHPATTTLNIHSSFTHSLGPHAPTHLQKYTTPPTNTNLYLKRVVAARTPDLHCHV